MGVKTALLVCFLRISHPSNRISYPSIRNSHPSIRISPLSIRISPPSIRSYQKNKQLLATEITLATRLEENVQKNNAQKNSVLA